MKELTINLKNFFKENKENEINLRINIETTVSKFLKEALEKISTTLDTMKTSLSQNLMILIQLQTNLIVFPKELMKD